MKRITLLLCSVAFSSAAAPVQWSTASGGNGHWYEYISTGSIFNPGQSFAAALAAANASTHLGQPGYLATVTSQAENDFLRDNMGILVGFGGSGSAYLGATDTAQANDFRWIGGPEAGQPVTFTNWAAGHPIGQLAGFDYLQILSGNLAGQWAAAESPSGFGYIVEYNDVPSGAVPEPSTFALLAGALGLLYRARQR
jgi:hypothetical protein